MPHVVIDVKNLALFAGGIAAQVVPFIRGWLAHRPQTTFTLVGPPFDVGLFAGFDNWRHHLVEWPHRLPRPLRHPFYDNVLFPRAVSRLRPDFLFSPYHDVRVPRSPRARSVITVFDTCIDELAEVYPRAYRGYYVATLRANLTRAAHVMTSSQVSRERIIERYGLPAHKVSVVYGAIDPGLEAPVGEQELARLRASYPGARLVFYPGGREHRKNVARLAEAFSYLLASGDDCRLLVTGDDGGAWRPALARQDAATGSRVHFLGRLGLDDLRRHYAAADVVAYPTLCEGFGRVCLDAMTVGTPLACSDLPVLREIAGDYPVYFDPRDSRAIAAGLREAMQRGRASRQRDPRFSIESVQAEFTALMDRLMSGSQRHD